MQVGSYEPAESFRARELRIFADGKVSVERYLRYIPNERPLPPVPSNEGGVHVTDLRSFNA